MNREIEELVYKFLSEEEFTIRNALAYAGVGLSKTTGACNDIIAGVGFSNHPYNDERKKAVAEHLGEMLFYWHVLASTTDVSPSEIVAQYMHSYRTKNNIEHEETKVSITELMRHVKQQVQMPSREREKEDEIQKKKWRERTHTK